jgi:hypothetical protein
VGRPRKRFGRIAHQFQGADVAGEAVPQYLRGVYRQAPERVRDHADLHAVELGVGFAQAFEQGRGAEGGGRRQGGTREGQGCRAQELPAGMV